MRKNEPLDDIIKKAETTSETEVAEQLSTLHPADIASVLDRLAEEEKVIPLFNALDTELAADILPHLQEKTLNLIINQSAPEAVGQIVAEMDSDDAADILADVDEGLAEKILDAAPDDVGEEVSRLMAFGEETAGGIMQTELFSATASSTVGDTVSQVRGLDHDLRMTIFNIYVVDNDGRLVGLMPIRDLIFNRHDKKLEELMSKDPVSVSVETDQEEVARLFQRYDLISLPVVDDSRKLSGRIMIDDIVDVIEDEASEDIVKMAGADDEALVQTHSASVMAWYRFPWLGASVAGGLATGWIIWQFKITIKEALALTVFIPLVMGVSGNVGTQSSALIIRGIATGRVNTDALLRYLVKEAIIGAILGFVCALLAGVAAHLWQGSMALGLVVGISIFLSVLFAAIMGAVIPLFFRRAKIDPAIAGGPIVLAFNDLTGILIFFAVASALLGYMK